VDVFQSLWPNVMIDVETQQMTMESRPLSDRKTISFCIKELRKFIVTYHENKEEAFHSHHFAKSFILE
jgi:hypothetical protein